MKILLTGADGFLGWHTRTRLSAQGDHEVVPVTRSMWGQLSALARDVDAIIHVAGVNAHGEPTGNSDLAAQVAEAARNSDSCTRIVYANTIHAGNGTPYGSDKARSAEILSEVAAEKGAKFVNLRFPNLFGEHARPNYNTFVATFIQAVIDGTVPNIVDRPIALLHAQEAAQALIDGLTLERTASEAEALALPIMGSQATVRGVYDMLLHFDRLYSKGDIPALRSPFEVSLFNSYRAALFPLRSPIPLVKHADQRGSFFETVRVVDGGGQTSFSTTVPGVTRGNHYHLRKIERFVVLSGNARISLRRIFSDEVVSFDVSGDEPCVVDMPTMWSHNIINIGSETLTTLFWINELFDPGDPDTFAEVV
ncbi:UDP-2-acetamido-2,6-beta-L-arabino-hexul-4-ose reductase [Raineyella antarctica]|uniref:UDP-2-acetamido-2,6-beta-L-arabino-hexul-4-ose reductase n=1 Tax=Raineyella antarctica TaxID=1577474 RepID=A0A1G6GEJ0_9ACTN|nr:NAD-dependent epimerase/dehydratase family protein [Raineyella antarctica]SDB80390.1 UDP-2-acetamido-2,6-beta-L-arabino-hexul-4-ose reductase [Raineyella antarctica]